MLLYCFELPYWDLEETAARLNPNGFSAVSHTTHHLKYKKKKVGVYLGYVINSEHS